MTDNPKEYPYPIGPLAESFPPLSPARHAALVVRIAQHSFRPAVIVWREEIIFGVALLKAYKEAINAICPLSVCVSRRVWPGVCSEPAHVLMARLRQGRAITARGAAHFLRETAGPVDSPNLCAMRTLPRVRIPFTIDGRCGGSDCIDPKLHETGMTHFGLNFRGGPSVFPCWRARSSPSYVLRLTD